MMFFLMEEQCKQNCLKDRIGLMINGAYIKKKKRKTILSKVNATVCRLDFSCWYFFFVVILFRSPCRLFLNSTHMYMYLAKLINEDALKCRTLTTYLMGCP